MTEAKFNAALDPWVAVQGPAGSTTVSLRDLLKRAHEFNAFALDRPLLVPQIVGIAVAVLMGILELDNQARLEELWGRGSFDADLIDRYFEENGGQFNLYDTKNPFFQVPGLEATSGQVKSAIQLRLDVPAGNSVPLFSAFTEADEVVLPHPEALRGLLELQGWDTAGIKGGTVGDPRVKSGKTTGNSTGPLGQLGVVIPIGRNVFETLLLNWPLLPKQKADRPVWEQSGSPAGSERAAAGIRDLLTWRSRAVRLIPSQGGNGVSGVVIGAGDKLPFTPYDLEFRTRWQTAKSGDVPLRPTRWQPGQGSWRGLSSLLSMEDISAEAKDGRQTARILQQLGEAAQVWFPDDYPVNLFCVGVSYGTQSAVIDDVYVDLLPLPVAALQASNEELRYALSQLSVRADEVRRAINDLQDNVTIAAGGEKADWDKGDHLGNNTMQQFAPATVSLLLALQTDPDALEAALLEWDRAIEQIAWDAVNPILDNAPTAAFGGRDVKSGSGTRRLRVADAEAFFRAALRKALPNLHSERLANRSQQ